MQLRLPPAESDFLIDCASISSFLSDNSDFQDEIVLLDSPIVDGDFSEYMWMENADEFDKEVMQQLEEDALVEECMEAMMDDGDEEEDIRSLIIESESIENLLLTSWELERRRRGSIGDYNDSDYDDIDLCHFLNLLLIEEKTEIANSSTLNPNAAEFVPQQLPSSSSPSEIKNCDSNLS